MDREKLESLHEKAAQRFLDGDYDAARSMWSQVLEVDPRDARALEGLRRCQESGGAAIPAGDGADGDLLADLGLEIDEAVAARSQPTEAGAAMPAAPEDTTEPFPGPTLTEADDLESMLVDHEDRTPAAERGPDPDRAQVALHEVPTPDRQGEGIDFGAKDAGALPLGTAGIDAPSVDSTVEPPPLPGRELDPSGVGAADEELSSRSSALLGDARNAADEGRLDDALAILARLSILDEDHEGAHELENEIRERIARDADALEDRINEGVQWLEAGRAEQAAERFREILEQAPDHREARHYLEEAEARLPPATDDEAPDGASRDAHGNVELEETGDLLDVGESAPSPTDVLDPGNVDLSPSPDEAPALAAMPALPEEGAVEPGPATIGPAPTAARRRRPGSIPVTVALVVVLAVGGWFVYDRFFSAGPASESSSDDVATGAGSSEGGDASSGRTTEQLIQEADRIASASFGQVSRAGAEQISEQLAIGREAMEAGDWAAAILAFDTVLEIDPDNAAASDGLREAGQQYRSLKAEEQNFDRAVRAFESGDYTSALRILYRLPDDIRPDDSRLLKIDGWYNLGLVELRAGDLEGATTHFEEAIALDPQDVATLEALELVDRFRGRSKDGTFYAQVEQLEFRGPST